MGDEATEVSGKFIMFARGVAAKRLAQGKAATNGGKGKAGMWDNSNDIAQPLIKRAKIAESSEAEWSTSAPVPAESSNFDDPEVAEQTQAFIDKWSLNEDSVNRIYRLS